MKNLIVVGNWKENKTVEDAQKFLSEFTSFYTARPEVYVIICPQFLSVDRVSEYIKMNRLEVRVGIQNVSKFEEGAHTGEVSARAAKEFASHVILGHSERRSMGESDGDVRMKVELAAKYELEPIVCVVNEDVPIPQGVKIVAYEPVEAIGTGNPDTPQNADKVAEAIKSKNPDIAYVLYGGSVTAENVASFTKMEHIDGVLVGGASLDPTSFSSIIKAC